MMVLARWERAMKLAVLSSRRYKCRAHVYKHEGYWTFDLIDDLFVEPERGGPGVR